MSISATYYQRPNGAKHPMEIRNIRPTDEAWFKQRNAKLSIEDDGCGSFISYADIGLRDEDGEPVEAIEIAGSRSCEDTMAALRAQCEALLAIQGEKQ